METYNLHVVLSTELYEKVEQAVERKARAQLRSPKRFKSEWVKEAILEKLERERPEKRKRA